MRTPNSRSRAAAMLANMAYTPTDASSSASSPNDVMRTTGRRRGESPVESTSSSGRASAIGREGSIAASSRWNGRTSPAGSPPVRTTYVRLS
jgi:hypothetical protein